MRPRTPLVIAVLAAAVMAGSARAGTAVLVTGHGWGHGVGMSQWGAYGYAKHGWTYSRILHHYYPGTSFGKSGEPRVRVLLAQNRKVVTVGCAGGMKVTNGARLTRTLKPGRYGLGPKLVLPIRSNGTGKSVGRMAVFSCAQAPLTLNGLPYHGELVAHRDGTTLSVVNTLKLDTYVRGVVPWESPSKWPLSELEAQAVAARSYALSELNPKAQYDLLPDTRSQMYGGVRAETKRTDKAVYATRGQILTYDGKVARTYYSSSSGGRTESSQEVWPGSAPIPYLRSVPDPYDTYSPNHSWGPYAFSASRLGSRLGLGGAVESARIARDRAWRVTSVRLRLASGAVVERSGEQIAQALHLKSTWFSLGVLRLAASRARVVYGGSVHVVAQTLGEKHALLQQRNDHGWWHTVQRVRHGAASLTLDARQSTAFRLLVKGTNGTSVDVAVAPRVRVRAAGPGLIAGKVLPVSHGDVEIWRREAGAWRVVARPLLDESGAFRTPLHLRPTVYRITVGADDQLVSATTQLVVTRGMLAALRH